MAQPDFRLLDQNLPAEAALAPIKGAGAVNALQSQLLQNQASNIEIQNALAEREAYKEAADTGMGVQQSLLQRGLGKQAAAYGKTVAETEQAKMKALVDRLPVQQEMAKSMALDPSPQNILFNLNYQVDRGWMTLDQAKSTWANLASKTPEQLREYFTQSAIKASEFYSTQLRQREADTAERRLNFEMDPIRQGGIAQAKATGTETGKSAAKAAADLPGAIESATRGIALIDEMIGDTTVNERGQLVYGKKKPHAGFESYVGGTLLPGARFIEGGDTASFELRQKQIEGQAFLDAFQTLKGGGQITEKEGEKATAAISRMNKAASEVEYVKAARELQEVLRSGVKKAKTKATAGGTVGSGPLPKNKWASALAEFEAQENQ